MYKILRKGVDNLIIEVVGRFVYVVGVYVVCTWWVMGCVCVRVYESILQSESELEVTRV